MNKCGENLHSADAHVYCYLFVKMCSFSKLAKYTRLTRGPVKVIYSRLTIMIYLSGDIMYLIVPKLRFTTIELTALKHCTSWKGQKIP